MTHDPNNWIATATPLWWSSCRRCGAIVFAADWQDDRDLHDAWHDDAAHQLAQARA